MKGTTVADKTEKVGITLPIPQYTIFVIVPVIAVLFGVQTAFAQTSSDWTLTVNAVNVPFGQSDIHIHVQGPFNANKDVNIANGQNPSYSFNMNGADFPSGFYTRYVSAPLW
jgi:hypothetical protein